MINGVGALATFATTLMLVVSKFREGAWLTAVPIPATTTLFYLIGRYHQSIEREIAAFGPIHFEAAPPPLIVIPMKRLRYTFVLLPRANRLKRLLQLHGLPQIIIINTPWYAEEATRNVNAVVTSG